MRLASIAAVLAALLLPATRAAEIPEQIPPKKPSLQATDKWFLNSGLEDNPDFLVFLEATTIGRVGGKAYAWVVWVPNRGEMYTMWKRYVFDCPGKRTYFDWIAVLDLNQNVLDEKPALRTWDTGMTSDVKVAFTAACAGKPLAIAEPMNVFEAMTLARSIQKPPR